MPGNELSDQLSQQVLHLQNPIDGALINIAKDPDTHDLRIEPVVPFPWPKYSSSFLTACIVFPTMFTLMYATSIIGVLGRVIEEKQNRLKQGMIMIGVSRSVDAASWAIMAAIRLGLVVVIAVVAVTYPIKNSPACDLPPPTWPSYPATMSPADRDRYENPPSCHWTMLSMSDASLVFVFYALYAVNMVAVMFLISAFCGKPKTGAAHTPRPQPN